MRSVFRLIKRLTQRHKKTPNMSIQKITLRNGDVITITTFSDGKPVPPARLSK